MESFITPIILSYVQKYVNLRPQDAQVSLWEGDAAFQNLDLRLDVLQSELQLPVEFLSGHIHELIIHIPWTKITSEPIAITINTIEFVLKLKDLTNVPSARTERLKSSVPVEEAPKGYLNSLVDKIVNNVTITCNNIILKYVEEDIVVSMNIQLLSFCSADEDWKQAFIDVNPANLVLRKLIQVSDLTICLDKRNSAGQIDVCQEPILYKCSLETRIFTSSAPNKQSSKMRIEIFTKSLELNISSQQFPMVMRLFVLAMSLRGGKVQGKETESAQLEPSEDDDILGPDSVLSWAWSKVPSIFPQEDDAEENDPPSGQVMTIGLYIANFKLTLKSLEMFVDSIVQSARKIRYNPIVRFCLNGIYSETFIYGSKWFNTKAGIAQAYIEPLGSFAARSLADNKLLYTCNEDVETYLLGSFFDSTLEKSSPVSPKHAQLDFDSHLREVDESYLTRRTPALSFDMLHILQIPDRHAFDPELNKDLEYSNLPEKTLIRIFIAKVTARHNSAVLRIASIIQDMVKSYDYPPYVEEKIEDPLRKLPPPLMDDYDALMNNIPCKTIIVTLKEVNIEMHPLVQSQTFSTTKGLSHKKSFSDRKIPYIVLRIENMEMRNVAPLYENRLVFTTCQLPDKPKRLLDACYSTFDVDARKISVFLADTAGAFTVMEIPTLKCSYGSILKEKFWAEDIAHVRSSCNVDTVCIRFSRPQEITLLRMFSTLFSYDRKSLWELVKSNARKNIDNERLDRLELNISNLNAHFFKYQHIRATDGAIGTMKAFVISGKDGDIDIKVNSNKILLFNAPKTERAMENFIKWKIQLPNDSDDQKYLMVALIKVQESTLILDPEMKSILCYEDNIAAIDNLSTETSLPQDMETKLSHISVTSDRHSKKTIQPDETIHLSSDKDDQYVSLASENNANHTTNGFDCNILAKLSNLVLSLEVDQCEIILPAERDHQDDQIRPGIATIKVDNLLIRLPAVKCKSMNTPTFKFDDNFPLQTDPSTITLKSGFSWNFEISDLSALMNSKGLEKCILLPIKTTVAIACEIKAMGSASNFALNVHLDTAPITCNICDDQIVFLKQSITLLSSLPNLASYTEIQQQIPASSQPKSNSALDDDMEIREFLAINSNSELSADVDSISPSEKSTVSIWLQWTFTKITLHFLALNNPHKPKLVLDIEDFITSIDKQNIYFKLKTKIGALSVQYFHLNDNNEWTISDDLKLAVQLQPSEMERQDAFLDFTLTVAEVENVLKKWGTKTRSDSHSTLSEVVLNLKAIDLQLSIKAMEAMLPIMELLTSVDEKAQLSTKKVHSSKANDSASIRSVSDLPLLHFDCKGIVVYIPTDGTNNDCNVVVLKIGHIKIRPNVENPLSRMPIRPDVYTKAEQLRILYTPGSKIEDRQYELTISNISALTSTWSEMLLLIKENYNTFYNSNPAVEWNNLDKRPTIKVEEIFKNFVISITYAPCITYKSTLICGQSIELNCVTDLEVDITVDQVLLINNVITAIGSSKCVQPNVEKQVIVKKRSIIYLNKPTLSRTNSGPHSTKTQVNHGRFIAPMTSYGSIKRSNSRVEKTTFNSQKQSENVHTDSGFVSVDRTRPKVSIYNSQVMPYEISLVAGVFSLKLRNKVKADDNLSELQPLVNIVITQPSMLITRKLYEYRVKYSIFNLVVKLGESDASADSEVLFETERGSVNPAGIAPPLLSVTFENSISKKVNVACLIGRPIRTHICSNAIQKVANIKTLLNNIFETTNDDQSTDPIYKPVVRGTPIRMIRNVLFNADSLALSLDDFQVECIHEKQCGVKVRLSKVDLKIENFEYPESFKIKFSVESLFIQTIKRALLHPLSIRCNIQLKQEQWHTFPSINCKFETNVIQVDLNPEHILNLLEIREIMMKTLTECFPEYDQSTRGHDSADLAEELNGASTESIILPKALRTEESTHKDEYFQDDLRAGAFQIIEVKGDSELLPLPYQMKISSSDRTICWRYPQPRCITKLLLYPIILESTTPTSIACRLEYYNDVLDSFVPYFDFNLSETESQTLQLPDLKIPSFIWRVAIVQKMPTSFVERSLDNISTDSDDITDGTETETLHIEDFIHQDDSKTKNFFNPRTLIACMRIDSSFQPHKIPTIQFVLRVPHLQVNFQNQLEIENYELPPVIQQFSIANDFYKNHTFASMILSNVNVYTLQWRKGRYSTNVDLNVACRVMDYSYLNMLDLLDHTSIKGFTSVKDSVDCNIVVDVMRFNVGPAMIHTILTSQQLWLQTFNKRQTYIPIMTRFVVCNSTNVPFQFGQTNSTELILLRPNECSFYAFRSDHLQQQITLIFETPSGRESNSFQVENEGTQYVKLGQYVIVIRIDKLSSTQLCIFIKGQLEILSMSKEHFEVQHISNIGKQYLDLGLYGHGSIAGDFKKGTQSSIRLKLKNEKGWSGEIPLVSKKVPWLVKVPVSAPQEFISFWVRIVEEDIVCPSSTPGGTSKPKRLLLLVWPMFILRSLLPTEIKVTHVSGSDSHILRGKGAEQELRVAASNTSEHELLFENASFLSPTEKHKIIATYKGVDRNTIFEAEGKIISIDNYVKNLKRSAPIPAPYAKPVKLRTMPSDGEMQCTYRIGPSQQFSSTLMIDIIPWRLFENSTGKRMRITNITNEKETIIDCNCMTALSAVEEAFKIQIACDTNWMESHPIFLNENVYKRSLLKNKLLLPETGNVLFEIHDSSIVSRFVLSSLEENNVRVLRIRSAFALVNFSNVNFDIVPFAFEENQKIVARNITEVAASFRYRIEKSNELARCDGVPLDAFYNLTDGKAQKPTNIPQKYYLCVLGDKDSGITLPLMINKSFNRKCFNIIDNNESISLMACVIEKDGQFVISIFNDKKPALEINNYTDLTFFVAGTKSADTDKSVKIMAELNEKGFDWHQILHANSKVFYTPPEMYVNFPDAENIQCNLSLALCLNCHKNQLDYKHNIRWSKPLRIDSSRETLLNVPLHGDVKILVCNYHKTVKISVFYITQGMEFSVKELRTRLSDPEKSSVSIGELRRQDSTETCCKANQLPPTAAKDKHVLDISCNACSTPKSSYVLPNLNLFFKELSASVFFDSKNETSVKNDMLSVHLDDVAFSFDTDKNTMSFIISNIQLDNQLHASGNYDFPVILCAQREYSMSSELPSTLAVKEFIERLKPNPLLEFRVNFYKDGLGAEHIYCKINPLRAYIEDTYVNDLMDHLIDCDPSNAVYIYEDQAENRSIKLGFVSIPNSVVHEALYLSGTLQLNSFRIEPINLMLSVHTCVRLYIALDHSPLYFSSYERRNILSLPLKFGHTIGMHYLSGAIFGAGWVVGSLEILGSPGGLARSLSTGLKDFVSMPVQGLFRGPWGFLGGITQGSASLLRNVTAGTVNSVTKLAASVARNLDRLTLDEEHFQRTEALRRVRPQGLAAGITQGLTGLGISLLGALGGLARHPLEARSSVEVVTGVAKGIFGAFAKPISGAAELLALTGQGMLHTVGFNTMPQQRNCISHKNIVACPADCKLPWKYLPNYSMILIDQLLFYHDATMISPDYLKRVIIALTPIAFIIVEYDKDCTAEVIPIERIDISIDVADKTLVEVGVLQSDEYDEEGDSLFFNNRMMSFLRDSSDNIPTTSMRPLDDLLMKGSSLERKYKLKRKFYINEFLALYLVRYLNVLKTSGDFLKFSVYH